LAPPRSLVRAVAGPPSPGLRPTSSRPGQVVRMKSLWQIDVTSQKRRLDPSPAQVRAFDACLSRSKGAIRYPRFTAGDWLVTDGIHRHKARHLSGLRSSELSSAHPQKAPAPGRLRAERDGTKDLRKSCQPLPTTDILVKFIHETSCRVRRSAVPSPEQRQFLTHTSPRRAKINYLSGRGNPRYGIGATERRAILAGHALAVSPAGGRRRPADP
jgi:hypothetical protein